MHQIEQTSLLIVGLPELTVSGPMLVGLAYNQEGSLLYLVDSSELYQIELN